MREFAHLFSWLGTIGVVTDYFQKNLRSDEKKNPTSVSTDGVLGRPNNWRSLDSRAHGAANSMPTLNANSLYQARKIRFDTNIIDLPVYSKQNAPAQRTAGPTSQGKAKTACVKFLVLRHLSRDVDN